MRSLPRPPLLDVAMSAALVAVSQSEVWLNALIVPKAPSAVFEFTAAAAIAWRRAAPLSAAVVVALAGMAEAATGVPMEQPSIPLVTSIVMMYSIISYVEIRRAVVGTAIIAGGAGAEVLIAGQNISNLGFIFTFTGLAWALGRIVRIRTSQAVEAGQQIARLEHERDEQGRRIATEERERIAREMHDVIAHSVSVMVVQAGAAQQVLRMNASAAEQAMESVQDSGRQAIAELGRLLGVLRDDGVELGLAPQPTLAELPQLVANARTAGLPVALTTRGTPRPLPAGVELAVFRIVQEALTNIRKHAGPHPTAAVVLTFSADDVAVEVSDDGPGATDNYGTGNGLIGMRERISTFGGTLTAGRGTRGGFSVAVRIPVQAAR